MEATITLVTDVFYTAMTAAIIVTIFGSIILGVIASDTLDGKIKNVAVAAVVIIGSGLLIWEFSAISSNQASQYKPSQAIKAGYDISFSQDADFRTLNNNVPVSGTYELGNAYTEDDKGNLVEKRVVAKVTYHDVDSGNPFLASYKADIELYSQESGDVLDKIEPKKDVETQDGAGEGADGDQEGLADALAGADTAADEISDGGNEHELVKEKSGK